MKTVIIIMLITFGVTLSLGYIVIPLLRKINFGQPILKYLPEHKEKSGTPTLGGLFFILPSTAVYLAFGGYTNRVGIIAVVITLSFCIVGLLDDLIKIKTKNNEGLKPYQKILFQIAISLLAGLFAYKNGLTKFYVPFSKLSFDVSWGIIPITFFVFIAITNSVNLTDGLDGLAGGTSLAYLLIMSIIIFLQGMVFEYSQSLNTLAVLSVAFVGSMLAYLFFNVNKAKVFMGDTGSLALGGAIGSISIFSGNTIFIAILGIMFVISSISVIIQVIHYKRTRKRVFIMAPFHHHLQHKGHSEAKISYGYFLITFIVGMFCILSYI